MTEPVAMVPVSIGQTSITTVPSPIMDIAAVAAPAVTGFLVTIITDTIVKVVHPHDSVKEQRKMYRDMSQAIAKSKLKPRSELPDEEEEVQEERVPIELDTDWTEHVKGAKQELLTAAEKVKCGKCKTTLGNLAKQVDSKTSDLLRNAARQKVMRQMKDAGKLPEEKTWDDLTERQKNTIRNVMGEKNGRKAAS